MEDISHTLIFFLSCPSFNSNLACEYSFQILDLKVLGITHYDFHFNWLLFHWHSYFSCFLLCSRILPSVAIFSKLVETILTIPTTLFITAWHFHVSVKLHRLYLYLSTVSIKYFICTRRKQTWPTRIELWFLKPNILQSWQYRLKYTILFCKKYIRW